MCTHLGVKKRLEKSFSKKDPLLQERVKNKDSLSVFGSFFFATHSREKEGKRTPAFPLSGWLAISFFRLPVLLPSSQWGPFAVPCWFQEGVLRV
jgi:hypothetical protein